jgi:hypothetical protein
MLSRERPVTLQDSYGAMVVGHGIGDLVPVVPGGPALRCVLTERLTRIPPAFSAGVYMLEGILDGLGPALLAAYLLLALALPAWTRGILSITLAQSVLLLLVPLILWQLSRRIGRPLQTLRRGPLARLTHLGHELSKGLQSVVSQDRGAGLSILGLSLLVTIVAAAQLTLFLHAFSLTASVRDTLLVLVLTLASGSIPIKIPGFGTLAAAAVLPVAGFHGPGLAGYVLVSRAVFSSETTVLAAVVLSWWTITRNRCFSGMSELFRLSRRARGGESMPLPLGTAEGAVAA